MPIVELTIDSSGAVMGAKSYGAAVDEASSKTDQAINKTNSWRDSLNKFGAIGIAAGAAAGAAIVGIGAKAIQLASDLEETENKYNVVFAGMTDTTDQFVETLTSGYMMTTEEAKRFLASTGDILKPMGMATEQAALMSNEMAQLAADLGSFNNQPTEQVMSDIQSALVGNYETMRKYGVVLSASKVEAYAYANGIAEVGAELTSAEKAQSAMNLIAESSTDAIGDMERSADSYANQMKQLWTNIDEITTQLGTVLLPIASEVVSAINDWISSQENLNKVIDAGVSVVRGLYNGFMGIKLALEAVIAGIAVFAEYAVKAFNTVMTPASKLFDALVKIGAVENNPFTVAEQAVESFAASAVSALSDTWASIESGNKYFDDMQTEITETGNAVDVVKEKTEGLAKTMTDAPEKAKEAWDGLTFGIEGAASKATTAQQTMNTTNEDAAEKAAKYALEQDKVADSLERTATAANDAAAATAGVAATQSRYTAGVGGMTATANGISTSGSTTFPAWFTPGMIAEWDKQYRDYLTNQDYIWGQYSGGPGIPDPFGGGPSRDPNPGDPSAWAQSQYGQDYINELTIHVNQSMSSDELASLISDLERATARA